MKKLTKKEQIKRSKRYHIAVHDYRDGHTVFVKRITPVQSTVSFDRHLNFLMEIPYWVMIVTLGVFIGTLLTNH